MNLTNHNSTIHQQNNYEINQASLNPEIQALLLQIEQKLNSDNSLSLEQRSKAQETLKEAKQELIQVPVKETAFKMLDTLKDIGSISEYVFKIIGLFV